MLDELAIQRESKENEIITYWMFKNAGYEVKHLDKDNSSRRPDYFVYEKDSSRGIICEVKSIFSAGYVEGKHISTYSLDPFGNPAQSAIAYDPWPKLWSILEEAISQYRDLLQKESSYKAYPFIVALFLEFFADVFDMIPTDLADYTHISAIIRVERNKELKDKLIAFNSEELLQIILGEKEVRLPPPSKKWHIIRNKSAEKPVSKKWFEPCFEA